MPPKWTTTTHTVRNPDSPWRTILGLSVLSAYIYILIEWLFFVTKRSFFDYLGMAKKLEIYLFTSALVALLLLALVGIIYALSFLPGLQAQRVRLARLAGLIPALVLASLALTVLDNFTYTVWSYGIATATGLMRLAYALLFLGLLTLFYRALLRDLPDYSRKLERKSWARWLVPGLLLLIATSLGFSLLNNELGPGWQARPQAVSVADPVNVLYITTDGLQANNMSVYGYERQTTPFIDSIASEMLIVENVFPNASSTSGSLMSALTGKYPAELRVLNAPDILRGQNAFQHVNGMLHQAGYFNAQFSIDYYADAYALNLLQAFDQANGRNLPVDSLLVQGLGYIPVDFAYFVLNSATRLSDRLAHIFFIQQIGNPYDTVNGDGLRNGDLHIQDFLALLETIDRPFFAQLHFINTHGPLYYLDRRVFSAGKPADNQELWDTDFFDDSILGFDQVVATLVDALKRKGIYDRTILIVSSDHGQRWNPLERIPLLIRFPNGEHAGRVQANAQMLDVIPTVLDHLQVPQPEWMDGRSLLQPLPQERLIFIASTWNMSDAAQAETYLLSPREPPFYQFDRLSVVHCQRWYMLSLSTNTLTSGLVPGTTTACPAAATEDPAQARMWIMEHLGSFGFEVSSLKP